jgi:di-N-acetylchitobiase
VDKDLWPHYNFTHLTTIATSYQDPKLICYAHARNVRVVYLSSLNSSELSDVNYREKWVTDQIKLVKETYADGINLDFEGPIAQDSQMRDDFSLIIRNLNNRMKNQIPGSQLSIDVGWAPGCIDGRCYDVHTIAQYVDLMMVMSYDESSQVMGPCIAMANSPPIKTFQGILEYINNGIPRDKLVMGMPWYGYDYPCLRINSAGECELASAPFRGIACSDAVGKEIGYGSIYPDMVKSSLTGRVFNNTFKTPMFNYKTSNGALHQVWYDDPESLGIKFHYAAQSKLRGLAVWNFDSVSYDKEYIKYTQEMYSAFDVFFDNV